MTDGAGFPTRWRWPAALAVGVVTFALSCLMVAPGTAVHSLGIEFATMAVDPFAGHGPFPHRVLGPLVAWSLGLGGERYWLFAHGTVVAFLAVVAATALRHGSPLPGALLLTATIATTGAVEVYKGHVGYAEPATFTLLLTGAMLTRRTGWFWLVQFLGLCNHEASAFFWPWLCWRKWRDAGGVKPGDWLGGGLAIGGYLLLRWWLLAHASRPTLTANIYFAGLPTLATAGMWAVAMVSAVVYFGVLPALLAWHARTAGFRAAGAELVGVLAGTLMLCTFATDIPRFIGFLALPTVFAGIHLLQRPHGSRWMAGLGVATAAAIVLQRPVVLHLVAALGRQLPEPFPAVVGDEWMVFTAYAVAIVAMVVAGRAVAARGRP